MMVCSRGHRQNSQCIHHWNWWECYAKGIFAWLNDKDVLAAIPAEERTIKNLDLDKLPIERALGQQWNIDTDTFGVKTSPPSARPRSDTRRGCLSTLSSIFDPLGMIGPVLLPAKRVLQKTWQLKLLWDEKLPEDLLKDWNKWKENLTLLNHVTIPRCFFLVAVRSMLRPNCITSVMRQRLDMELSRTWEEKL